ncbi:hypothetical protein PENSPDRAFT_212454 [Peniophora sp. CONT]|nr:hypothetical protein PENSPDRAFT_212454 [Peniophora sp. CONT]
MSNATPSRIYAPKPQRPYPASPLSRPTSPTSTTPRGSSIGRRGRGSSRPNQPSHRPAERRRSPIPPFINNPASRSNTPAPHSPSPSSRRQWSPIDHSTLKTGDIVLVVESAQYPLFQFIDSPAGGATRDDEFNRQRQLYLSGAGRHCKSGARPAMIVKPDANGQHTVLIFSSWNKNPWDTLSALKQFLSVEIRREGFEPECRHLSGLALSIPGWKHEDVSYMILHPHKLSPSNSLERRRGHIDQVLPFSMASTPEERKRVIDLLLELEQMAKKAWLQKTQSERDTVIAQFFRDANFVECRGSDTPSPSKASYRAPQVHVPGGSIIRPQKRSPNDLPTVSRCSSPVSMRVGLLY